MVASVTAEVKVQVDKMEVLAPTIVPLQNDIASLNARSAQLQQDIATMKSQAAANATDKASKDDTVANTTNDIKILKQSIEQKKAEIDPLPGAIEVGIPPPPSLSTNAAVLQHILVRNICVCGRGACICSRSDCTSLFSPLKKQRKKSCLA